MKVVLIYCRQKEQARWQTIIPLGITYLGTILKNKGYDVTLIDHSFTEFNDLIRIVKDINPDYVGLSAMSAYFEEAKKIGLELKEFKIILGGPHASIMSEEDLEKEDWIDFLVRGEGESLLPDLIQNPTKRIWESTEKIKNLDEIPFPDLDLLPDKMQYLGKKKYNLLTSRGCPYTCTFCQPGLSQIWGKGVRYRSAKNVIEEMTLINKQYGITDFGFLDDMFIINIPRLREILGFTINKFTFDINSRVDCFNETIARELKICGCTNISFGVESGSQKILSDDYKKKITIKQIKNAFAICHKLRIKTKAYIMLGSIHETQKTLKETEKLIKEIKPDVLSLSITTPFKGTELYEMCKDRISDQTLDFRSFKNTSLPIKNDFLTLADVNKWKERIMKSRRLKFIVKNAIQVIIKFIKKPSIKFLISTYRDFKSADYIG
jgi:radical SAM superfamily enzyme YgiQ (UPF0313 family)